MRTAMMHDANAFESGGQVILRGELTFAEPLAEHTSWRTGGVADRFYRPADLADLRQFLAQLPAMEPLYWIGLGSNLLVRDGGVRGTVICTKNRLREMRLIDANRLYVEVGTPCALVARFAAEADLDGAEFLAGIPGTMGGALAMNAGAFGGETWPLVESVVTVDRDGTLRERRADQFEFGYRHVSIPDAEWFVACTLWLEAGAGEAGRERIKVLLARRAATQPTQQPSCGSVFRNPPGDHAARLIEACGLKGRRIGGAEVSEKHANFIVNVGSARAADIESLIGQVRQTVLERFGILLETEVRIIGESEGEQA